MFKPGNHLASDVTFHMTGTEFRFYRRLYGWSRRQAAYQFGVTLDDIDSFESSGHIPEHIEAAVKQYGNGVTVINVP